MKKFTALLLVLLFTVSLCGNAYAQMVKITPSAGYSKVDRYAERGDEDFILIYYNRTCSNSQKMVPMIEEYGEDKGILTYGVDYSDGPGMSVSRIIDSNVVAFPVVIAYNGQTKELSGINEVRTREQFESFLDNAFSTSVTEIKVQVGSNKLVCNGTTIKLDVPAQIINGRTMVPLRAIFEALGATVQWDDSVKRIRATRNANTVVMFVDNESMFVNSQVKILDVPPVIVDGRTLVPVRAVSEAFNCEVEWDESTKTVTIK